HPERLDELGDARRTDVVHAASCRSWSNVQRRSRRPAVTPSSPRDETAGGARRAPPAAEPPIVVASALRAGADLVLRQGLLQLRRVLVGQRRADDLPAVLRERRDGLVRGGVLD